MTEVLLQNVRFDERGLIPAVVQDASTNEVIALRYLDNSSLAATLKTGSTKFVDATGRIVTDGASRLLDVRLSEDGSSLTILISRESLDPEPEPVSLLHQTFEAQRPAEVSLVDVGSMEFGLAINNLYSLIADRKEKRPEGSYTTYLFNSGLDKILKKIAEEAGEVIIAAKNRSPRETISELADLFYHLLVLMVEREVKLSDVRDELISRANQSAK
ncbi:MAG TPA: phosphoribosyl-ATP diphosphatase [Blastocatellia bacterium]|nr:phosphoribosyl-ATP diphosphatase [Blastocatellia bacterium]